MTPHEAHALMRGIRHNFEKDEARDRAVELLCKIARMSGYFRTVDEFEKIK